MAIQYMGQDDLTKLINTISNFTISRELRQGNMTLGSLDVNANIMGMIENLPEPLNMGIYNNTTELYTTYPNGVSLGIGKYAYVNINSNYVKFGWNESSKTWSVINTNLIMNTNTILNLYYNINGIEMFSNNYLNTVSNFYPNKLGYFVSEANSDFTFPNTAISHTGNVNVNVTFNSNKYMNSTLVLMNNGVVIPQPISNINTSIQFVSNSQAVYSRLDGNAIVNAFVYTDGAVSSKPNNVLTFNAVT